MSNFESLGLLPELISAVEGMGWSLPHDVQDEAIPLILGGGDVMIAAETGSGKTGAFCLPLLQSLYEHLRGDADVTAKIVLNNPLAGDAGSSLPAAAAAAASSWVMSLTDRDPICAVDGATGLLVQTRHPRDWAGVRANFGLLPTPGTASRWYFEATVTDEGLCRVGLTSGTSSTRNLGTDGSSWGYGGTGKKSHANKFDDYGAPFKLADTVGVLVEFKSNGGAEIGYTKNGSALGVAFTVAPALASQGLYPAVVLKNAEMRFNFGTDLQTAPFKHAPPQGFRAVAEASAGKERTAAGSSAAPAAAPAAASSSAAAAPAKPSAPAASPSPFAIIFEPTRELALQVAEELAKFCVHLEHPHIKHECFVGGGDNNKNQRTQGLHIVVGTPGRLGEMVKSGKLNVTDSRFLVLDEADQLVGDSQTKKLILDVYEAMPKHSKGVQVVICSATLHSLEIQLLAQSLTHNATWVDLKGKDSIPESVDHVVLVADPQQDRQLWMQNSSASGSARVRTDGVHAGLNLRSASDSPDLLSEALKILKPHLLLAVIDAFLMDSCMLFVRTQLDCDNLEAFLIGVGGGSGKAGGKGFEKRESGKENPYSCVVLHGGRSAQERARNLDAFKSGAVRFLICTDVAARGIDISNLPFVINLCLPDKPETYIHRVGRVGRAGAVGLAISIVAAPDIPERVWWHTCNSKDKGRSCTNTKLVEAGGCTMWFDEPDMLSQIETRLGNISIPRLDRMNLAQGGKYVAQVAAKGRRVVDDGSAASGQHVNVLRPTVEELARLEVTAQCTFWNVKQSAKWASMLK